MTIASKARAAAVHCTAKKYAYRQTRDGVIVSFVLHPNEVPDELAVAQIGTCYMLALVEIDENDQPKGGDAVEPTAILTKQQSVVAPPVQLQDKAGRAKRQWDELSAAEQAGIRCAEPAFCTFLADREMRLWNDLAEGKTNSAEVAAEIVRQLCRVNSRAQINPANPKALAAWNDIDNDYRLWMMAPEYADA